MSTTALNPLGLICSAGTTKLPAALLTSRLSPPSSSLIDVEGLADCLVIAYVQRPRHDLSRRGFGRDLVCSGGQLVGVASDQRDASTASGQSTCDAKAYAATAAGHNGSLAGEGLRIDGSDLVGHQNAPVEGLDARRREMISRWMSEVPSSISSSLASRIHFSARNSREYPQPPSV